MITRTTLIAFAALMLAAPAWSGQVTRNEARDLAKTNDKLAARALETKGIQRQELMLEQRRVQGLIDDLQAGRAVDPSAIDRALKQTEGR